MGKSGTSRGGMKSLGKKLSGSASAREKIYLRGKEELTGTQAGKPRWDEGFFRAAAKQKEYKGVKY